MPLKNSKSNRSDPLKFAEYYHAHHREFTDDLPFWKKLAKTQNGPILELGCGTGRVLLPLAKTGQPTYGIDLDSEMLNITKSQMDPKVMTNIHIFQADMRDFQIDEKFSFIFTPCNTLSTLTKADRRKTLSQAHKHLDPHGVFAMSIPNPEILASLEASDQPEIETTFPHPKTGDPVQVSCDWKRLPGMISMNWYYDHLRPDGHVERFMTSTSHYLAKKSEYVDEIQSAGFSIQSIYGDFDYEPYDADSPNLILIAQKI